MPIHKVDDQRGMIHRCMDTHRALHRQAPGRLARPRADPDLETPELLAEAGVQYIGDWVYDDEPTEIDTAHGPLVTLPYTVELNDIPTMMRAASRIALLGARCQDTSTVCTGGRERAEDHGDRDPPLHLRPAAPHPLSRGGLRLINRHDGVLHWNGAEILDWWDAGAGR